MDNFLLPKISVITPAFNAARYIEEAIKSVLKQEYPNFEHIIVDGGSTDGTIDILKKYPHLIWISEKDKGQSDAMNKGFRMSSGEIIVYLNADDFFLKDSFNTVISYFQKGTKFVVGNVKILREDNTYLINNPKILLKDMLRFWKSNCFPCNPVGYFYTREVQESIGGFNVNNHLSMDYEFILEAAIRYKFVKIQKVLGVYRYLPQTKTFNADEEEDIKYLKRCIFSTKYLKYLPKSYREIYLKDLNLYIITERLKIKERIFKKKGLIKLDENKFFNSVVLFFYSYIIRVLHSRIFKINLVKDSLFRFKIFNSVNEYLQDTK